MDLFDPGSALHYSYFDVYLQLSPCLFYTSSVCALRLRLMDVAAEFLVLFFPLCISLLLPTAFVHQTSTIKKKKKKHIPLLSKEDVWSRTESKWDYFTVMAIIFLLKITLWRFARIRLQYGQSTCF